MDHLQKLLEIATQQGLLTPIGVDTVKMRTSLYVDYAMLFPRLVPTHVDNLQHLLHHFGEATELCTNIHKCQIFPIRCDDIHIPSILGQF
jgi:hypothetical protein